MVKDNDIPEWKVAHEAMLQSNRDTMALLSDTQSKAITTAKDTLELVLDMITQTNDMYLSDVRKLEDARWQLYSAFRTD
jgi:hypothetical protein